MSETVAVRVYIPQDTGQIPRAKGYMSETFGGCSVIPTEGSWVDPQTDEIVAEKTGIVESVTDHPNAREKIQGLARRIQADTDETEVMWEIRPVRSVGFES